jgi:hydroxymethylglutaryl-CoA lyase
MSDIQLVECPRDAMQGIQEFIPTEKKIAYINQLLKVGFHTLDFGSFVSPKAIPQLADTAEVLAGLDLKNKQAELLAIVANERGAEAALTHSEIDVLGYPFSISETFLQRNINSNIEKAYERLKNIKSLTDDAQRKLVVYISMAFGNPYEDAWSEKLLSDWVLKLYEHQGIEIIALSDTIGSSNPELIKSVFSQTLADVPSSVNIGAHLHSTPQTVREKVEAAYSVGCRRFDSALGGYGGCPMAADDLTGNMQTETVIEYLNSQQELKEISTTELTKAMEMLSITFPL